jgi:RNA 3'-terminal phosphate cyclase (ATP)
MTADDVVRIDGSYGEGGGQILRTALALAAVTQRPLELVNIRKQRKRPGLANQHLACVRAVAALTDGAIEGDRLGSTALRFTPRAIRAGDWRFDVAEERGSAGSVTLLFQALLPILCRAPGPSSVTLLGGTHVPWSPPVHYLQAVFLPMLARLGARVSLELVRPGWYPKGGGEIRAAVDPAPALTAQQWMTPGALQRIRGWSIVSNLPRAIALRQRHAAEETLHAGGHGDAAIDCVELPSRGPGTCVVLVAERERTCAGFSSLGKIGTSAEQVGAEAATLALRYLASGAALDEHLADQIVLFLAQAAGPSRFTAARATGHVATNLWTIQQFLPVRTAIEAPERGPGRVTLEPLIP